MIFKIAKVHGLNSDQQASLTFVSQQDFGTFLAILSINCDDAFSQGRQTLSELADLYFDTEGAISQKLSQTFNFAQKSLRDKGFSLLLAVISASAFYLVGQGEICCYLRRFDKEHLLDDGSGKVLSGFLKEGDRVFLATRRLIALLEKDLSKLLDLPRETFEEEISSRLGALEEEQPGGLAGLIVDAEEEEDVVIPRSLAEGSVPGEPSVKVTLQKAQKLLFQLKTNLLVAGKVRLALAAVLILVLALGVSYRYKTGRDKERDYQFDQLLKVVKEELTVSQSLKTLNPTEAQNKLANASENLKKALLLKPKDKGALELKKQIEETPKNGQKFYDIAFGEFLDLNLIKKGFLAKHLSLSSGKLLIFNPQDKTLVGVDLAKKSHQILAGKDALGNAQVTAISGNLAFVYSQDKGVVRVDMGNQRSTPILKSDKDWGEILDISSFGGNIYLLDKKNNQIWKYLPTTEGFSEKREYLAKGTKADFVAALRMQIESSVYVLKQDGGVSRFTRGEYDNFAFSGLDKPLKDPKSFFVSPETDRLYILDSGNSRLLVLGKTGEYKKQYLGNKFAAASDLVVDEKNNKVYLLESSKIWQIELK